MKIFFLASFVIAFLIMPFGFILAQETFGTPPPPSGGQPPPPPPPPPPMPPPGTGSTGGSFQTPPPPPPGGAGMQQNYQNYQQPDGASYQPDGANYQQKDGTNYMMPGSPPKGSMTPGQMPSRTTNSPSPRSSQGQEQGGESDSGSSLWEKQQEKQQQANNKRMGKQLNTVLKAISKIQTKLKKSGISLSLDCQTTISDATTMVSLISAGSTDVDQSDIGETMQSIGHCQMMGKQLTSVPMIYKTLSKSVLKFKKKYPEENIDDMWNAVDKDFLILKSGEFEEDDIFSFFDNAQTLAEDIGIDTRQFGPMPQGSPRQDNGGGMMQQGINQGASAIKSIGSFFGNIFNRR